MGRLRVTVRSDGLAAELQAVAGPPVTAADVHSELVKSGVVHGIDAAAIDDVVQRLADSTCQLTQVVARGDAPVPGADGAIECAACEAPRAGVVQADGSIDFRERELLHPAAVGQVIARIVPPTPGTPGRTVRGAPIATRAGKPTAQRLGPGVRADGEQVVATCGGVVLHSARQIDVVALYTHAANVDLESGNLHTSGSLLIRGDVCEGFLATADGDVQVTGAVLDARVNAGGSLRVDQGILGEGCDVQAGEHLGGRHATSARLHAGGTIELRDGATHCRIVADHIRILAGRGVAFGGELCARQSIELRVAGTAGGSPTRLSVCDLNEERAELVRRESDAARLGRSCARHGRGDAKAVRQATRAADHSDQERLRMLQRQREMLSTAAIRIADTVFPGVVLQFGQQTLRVTEPLHAASFRYDVEQDTIVQCPLP
jgi:uncharacterized protein (DUF342 family)